ncbi:unnamed protein product [Phyllotreta striolata]|uniref:Uncharacterized protein n=1 Tax=Phyllotreta striolata TaxID=444603 RepID=A0A9N9TZP8_PHYSR|nr:unnamed protein product [Phyllotreta striolata]
MDDTSREPHARESHPIDKNFISKLFFCWFVPFIIRGLKKEISEDNIYKTGNKFSSLFLSTKLQEAWDKELSENKPSLMRALLKVFKYDLITSALLRLSLDLLKLIQPILITLLITCFQTNKLKHNPTKIYMFSLALIAVTFLQVMFIHHNMLLVLTVGMKIRIATCALVYRKALRLSKSAIASTTIGQLVNLISNDVARFDVCCQFIHLLWLAPCEIVIVMVLLNWYVGWMGLVGCVFLLGFIPFQPYMAGLASRYRLKTAICTDERVRLMNDIISGIHVIKMYTWEKPFELLVERIRKLEMNQIRHISMIRAVMLSFTTVLSRLAVYICIVVLILGGYPLNAYFVFTVISFYSFLRNSVILLFPQAVIQVAEARISILRLQKFLMIEEIDADNRQVTMTSSLSDLLVTHPNIIEDSEIGINIKNAAVKWIVSSPDHLLKDVNFEASSNQLVALIGPVGGGKSTLLHLILKEVIPLRGEVEVNGSVSYASQEPWIFGGSIRQNIIFGQSFEPEKYRKVIRACALERDFNIFPYGDKTIVGERGATLSGGQKARVNLARAVYKDADIYLLDDPLAAVDVLVGKQLFNNCICGYLRSKCVVLVTHQVHYLNAANLIYLLEDGTIRTSSTFQTLQSYNKTFMELLETAKEEEQKRKEKLKSSSMDLHPGLTSHQELVKEHIAKGAIRKTVYRDYFLSGGHWIKSIGVLMAFFLSQFFASLIDVFLTSWVNSEQKGNKSSVFREHGLLIYTILMLILLFLAVVRAISFFKHSLKASERLHSDMLKKVLYSPMSFYNSNTSGRILNRFSKDIGSLDETIPLCMVDTITIGLTVLAVTIVIAIVNPWIMIPTLVIFIIMLFFKMAFLKTSRNIKRIEAITRSPIYTHLTASLQGITTIRAFGAEEILCKKFDDLQDNYTAASYLFLSASRGFGFWLDMHCLFYIALVVISLLFVQKESFSGNVGLSLTQAVTLAGMFQWGIRQWSELENQMTSVERVKEYSELPMEVDDYKTTIQNWPKSGKVVFRNVYLKYTPGGSYVLNNLNFEVKSGEKVGIVGRTGAGKSSIIQVLFRLLDFEGAIHIDDVDSKTIKLKQLRSKISIIPQEPLLFSGTLRRNVDPFNEHNDESLWKVLQEVDLKNAVAELPSGLDTTMSEGGLNFSLGQRQLLCLARAIIRNNKILILDEATANVDPTTDDIIQTTIREKFSDCTVFTIAHRLQSIMDSDKILVMDGGRAIEFDHPYELLVKKPNGIFYKLVKETDSVTFLNLLSIAEEHYFNTTNDDSFDL